MERVTGGDGDSNAGCGRLEVKTVAKVGHSAEAWLILRRGLNPDALREPLVRRGRLDEAV